MPNIVSLLVMKLKIGEARGKGLEGSAAIDA